MIQEGEWASFWNVFDEVRNIDKDFKVIFEAIINEDETKRCSLEEILKH